MAVICSLVHHIKRGREEDQEPVAFQDRSRNFVLTHDTRQIPILVVQDSSEQVVYF